MNFGLVRLVCVSVDVAWCSECPCESLVEQIWIILMPEVKNCSLTTVPSPPN